MERVFPLGTPVGPKDVLHPDVFLDEVAKRLWDGQSVMIAGPRRIGKSSAAHEILRHLHQLGAYTASADLFYTSSLEEMGAQLLQAILANRTGPFERAVRAVQELRDWIRVRDVRAKVHDLEIGLALEQQYPTGEESVVTAFQIAERLARKDGKRMVVLLDEFQELNHLGGENLIKKLRALFQQQQQVTYLFLGSKAGLMRTIFADRRQAFYRFAVLMELPEIPPTTWRQYLTGKFGGLGLNISRAALEELLEETGGHPYSVMAVASTAYYLARGDRMDTIDRELIHHTLERTLDLLEEVYQDHWEEIRKYKHAAAVFRAVIRGEPPYGIGLHSNQVHQALTYLQRISVLQKKHRGEYRLIEPLFGRWFKRNMG